MEKGVDWKKSKWSAKYVSRFLFTTYPADTRIIYSSIVNIRHDLRGSSRDFGDLTKDDRGAHLTVKGGGINLRDARLTPCKAREISR